jgi:LSD1 subclass zinc finger protein
MTERRVVVSTECPTCGAPLDFSEGSNAVRCAHCRSNLLVTGRRQVLTYFIPARIEPQKARAQAALALKRAKTQVTSLEPKLYFVPFYRMTAQDFIWAKPEPKPLPPRSFGSEGDDAAAVLGWGPWSTGRQPSGIDLLALAGSVVGDLLSGGEVAPQRPAEATELPVPSVVPANARFYDEVEFDDQHVEKNFIAADLKGLDLFSIGVRSSVLKLELFRRNDLEERGLIVPIDLDAGTAWKRGLMLSTDRVIYRQTVGGRLSMIYFPFWILRGDGREGPFLVVVDGVSGGVGRTDGPIELEPALKRGGGGGGDVVSFRPLVCPNCGWDIPAQPEDAIFLCTSCDRAWLLEGKELRRIPHAIVTAAAQRGWKSVRHLPFWSLTSGGRQMIVPAFRYRQLKHLQMMATRLARTPQQFETGGEAKGDFVGGFYDAGDAARLARFITAGITIDDGKRVESEPTFSDATLLWIPFRAQGNYLFDPFFGTNLFATLLS